MKKSVCFSVLALGLLSANAWAAKDCEALKSELTTKIESHGAKNFTLDVVERDAEATPP